MNPGVSLTVMLLSVSRAANTPEQAAASLATNGAGAEPARCHSGWSWRLRLQPDVVEDALGSQAG